MWGQDVCTKIRQVAAEKKLQQTNDSHKSNKNDEAKQEKSRHSTLFTVFDREEVHYKSKYQIIYSIIPSNLPHVILTVNTHAGTTHQFYHRISPISHCVANSNPFF
jgi:hypothetical protein